MFLNNPTVVTRYGLENVLKVGYPCSCHLSPFESETYNAYFDSRNPNEYPARIARITVKCSNCGQSKAFDVEDRYLTELDFQDL